MSIAVSHIDSGTCVGEVVMKTEMTAFIYASQSRRCQVYEGSAMLFEQIPADLEFFGLLSTTPDKLRSLAKLAY